MHKYECYASWVSGAKFVLWAKDKIELKNSAANLIYSILESYAQRCNQGELSRSWVDNLEIDSIDFIDGEATNE